MFASKDIFLTPPSGGYTIGKSVRLRSSASAYFNRTPASASNQQKWTWSGWLKRGQLGVLKQLFAAGSGTTTFQMYFNGSGGGASSVDGIELFGNNAGTTVVYYTSTAVRRDPSAWYHIVLAVDTTQATAGNRVLLWVNNQISTDITGVTVPAQNTNLAVNSAAAHYLGQFGSTSYFDGYLTEINFIDGQALTPSSFGSFNATTGVWQPAKYTGTYGTNGFYLNFSSNGTSAALGTDFSGNSNTWTVNNVSVTAGVTYDSMVDSPTVSAVSSNYCVVSPINKNSAVNIASGNLMLSSSSAASWGNALPTFGVSSGKWYWEVTLTTISGSNYVMVGIDNPSRIGTANGFCGDATSGYAYYNNNGQKYNANTGTVYGAAFTQGDLIGVALDMDSGTLTFYKNNTSQGTAFTGITGTFGPAIGFLNTVTQIDVNFGQRPFTYTPPTGYVALNTYNLPASTITNGAKYMSATTYAGSASQQVINSNMTALDFAWIKNRTTARSHALVDTVRGGSPMWTLFSDLTAAESNTSPNYNPTSISGSSITLGGATLGLNNAGENFVMWGWYTNGGSSSSNTNGSITSTVSVGATQGFSVVTYTGTGVLTTVGHGLGAVPNMIILKARNTTGDWQVYTSMTGAGNYLLLDTTAASAASSTKWNNTTPTSSVFSVGVDTTTNMLATTYVAYCFAAVKGFSAFGSYTGNGSADGPFVYLGFRPRFVLVKRTDTTGSWELYDSSRSTYNEMENLLEPNNSNAEYTSAAGGYSIDFTSNGFKIRGTGASYNGSGGSFIYAAFAENPFKNSLAR